MKTDELRKQLERASKKMYEAVHFENTEPFRDATIQRFEYTFELSWKLMSSILNDQGLEAYGVRNVIREAAKLKLINNPELWFTFADARNQTSHIYREEVALEVYKIAIGMNFLSEIFALLKTVEQYQ